MSYSSFHLPFRLESKIESARAKATDLPHDYLRLVEQSATEQFQETLAEFRQDYPEVQFQARGDINGEEVILGLSLNFGATVLNAVTVYSSAPFLAHQDRPSLEQTLNAVVDAASTVFVALTETPEKRDALRDRSWMNQDTTPIEWTKVETHLKDNLTGGPALSVFVRCEGTNFVLESATEAWLNANDPDRTATPDNSTGFGDFDQEAESFFEERLDRIQSAKSGAAGTPNMH